MEDATPASNDPPALATLSATEARLIGCLIEKAAITPEVYPLTLNALVAASNQKTSREPIMNLEPGAIGHALRELEGRGLVKVAQSSQRVLRYEHRFDTVYGVTARQRAVLCVMLLRGPQTIGELHTRSERLAEFPSIDDVRDTLDRLIQREPACVVRLGRGSGQREDRYMHLLGGPVDAEKMLASLPSAPASSTRSDLHERVERLEMDMRAIREEMAALRQSLGIGE